LFIFAVQLTRLCWHVYKSLRFVAGAGLNKASGYSETTSDSQCTQYSSANYILKILILKNINIPPAL